MNYTENYRLPQWEEGDRVMRLDFNRMCGVLEDALTASGRARRRLERLARDAYRQTVQDWVHHGCGGLTDSMWVNALESREAAGGDGHGWTGQYGLFQGPGAGATLEGIVGSAKEEARIDTNPLHAEQCRRAAVTFTSDGFGVLESVVVWSLWNGASTLNSEFTFTITCTRLDTGEVVGTAGPFESSSSKSTYLQSTRRLDFPLEKNISYRLEYKLPDENGFCGDNGFLMATTFFKPNTTALFLADREPLATIEKTVTAPDVAEGAIGILRWRGDGAPVLLVNGTALEAVREREAINALGESCRETEYSLEPLPEGEFTLTLDMVRGEGDLYVFDYGLIWR